MNIVEQRIYINEISKLEELIQKHKQDNNLRIYLAFETVDIATTETTLNI
jgi:hypothetical protein